MKVALVEWPEGLLAGSAEWDKIARNVEAASADLLITNELPFGTWLATKPAFDQAAAERSIAEHAAGEDALAALQVGLIISSRPVWEGTRLANEAFALVGGSPIPIHRKRFFPDEAGWYERAWFGTGRTDFTAAQIGPVKAGVLLCTEAMFNEYARDYGLQEAGVIAIPRATGASIAPWLAAGAMAAIVSGTYVISSNRVGPGEDGIHFGGSGFAVAPDGSLLGQTSPNCPLLTVDIDLQAAAERQRSAYPLYVARAARSAQAPQGLSD